MDYLILAISFLNTFFLITILAILRKLVLREPTQTIIRDDGNKGLVDLPNPPTYADLVKFNALSNIKLTRDD